MSEYKITVHESADHAHSHTIEVASLAEALRIAWEQYRAGCDCYGGALSVETPCGVTWVTAPGPRGASWGLWGRWDSGATIPTGEHQPSTDAEIVAWCTSQVPTWASAPRKGWGVSL